MTRLRAALTATGTVLGVATFLGLCEFLVSLPEPWFTIAVASLSAFGLWAYVYLIARAR